jgi:hypothetical protein
MVLKTPPNVLYKGLKEVIGSPEDYFRNKSKNHFPDYDTRLPLTAKKDILQIPTRASSRLEESKGNLTYK